MLSAVFAPVLSWPSPMQEQRTHHPQLRLLPGTHWQMVWGMRLHPLRHPSPPLMTLKQQWGAALGGLHAAANCWTACFAGAAEGLPAGRTQQELAAQQSVNAYWAEPALRVPQLPAGMLQVHKPHRAKLDQGVQPHNPKLI